MFYSKTAPMAKEVSQVQKEEVNVVYKTKDLSIFKMTAGNRIPNPQHIKRLQSSIKQYGMLCNPILVNEKMEIIDGQHRLLASKEVGSEVYFIILQGYSLKEVHTLNLNQKNWTKHDFMDGYASMGIKSYIDLKNFSEENTDFTLNDCIAFCSNITTSGNFTMSQKISKNIIEVFEEGTWKTRDIKLAQENADKIRLIKPYYSGYNRSVFVGTILSLFQNKNFDFNEFMHKLRLQPTALVDCAKREQYKTLIEDIYNYKSRKKVNLRY